MPGCQGSCLRSFDTGFWTGEPGLVIWGILRGHFLLLGELGVQVLMLVLLALASAGSTWASQGHSSPWRSCSSSSLQSWGRKLDADWDSRETEATKGLLAQQGCVCTLPTNEKLLPPQGRPHGPHGPHRAVVSRAPGVHKLRNAALLGSTTPQRRRRMALA